MKVTEFEINTEPYRHKGIHTTGPDGKHCMHCGIDTLNNAEKGEDRRFADTSYKGRRGPLDDFIGE